MSTRLAREVWALGRCSGCGACVAACAKGVLYWGQEQHPLLEERQKRLGLSRLKLRPCEVCDQPCEASCPRLEEPAPPEAFHAVSARADGIVREGSIEAVIQSLLVGALSAGLIDGAIAPHLDPWTLAPGTRVATTVEELAGGIPLQYLWAPGLGGLNEAIFDCGLERVAVVGPPCVAAATRRLMCTAHERLQPYRRAIRLAIAYSCTGSYSPDLVARLLAQGLGVSPKEIRKLTADAGGGILRAALWDGGAREVALAEVQAFTRRGCGNCHDYLGEAADVSVGPIGALRAHVTLIARTAAAEALVRNAWALGLLQIANEVDGEALAEARAAKGRRGRAEEVAEAHILMLDSLADPRKRAQARERFAGLYGARRPKAADKEVRDGGCAGCSGSGC